MKANILFCGIYIEIIGLDMMRNHHIFMNLWKKYSCGGNYMERIMGQLQIE